MKSKGEKKNKEGFERMKCMCTKENEWDNKLKYKSINWYWYKIYDDEYKIYTVYWYKMV